MIAAMVDEMYSLDRDDRFIEVTYANGDKEVLYFKDFASGAMIESIVRRAKKLALKRYIQTGDKGITLDDFLAAVREEFKENEDLPNTTNPDDWAKIADKKGGANRVRQTPHGRDQGQAAARSARDQYRPVPLV